MAIAAFDTYAAAKTLREAGFDERQAEAAVAVVHDAITGGVATKADLAELKADMLKVAIGLVIANVAFTATLTVALIKLLA